MANGLFPILIRKTNRFPPKKKFTFRKAGAAYRRPYNLLLKTEPGIKPGHIKYFSGYITGYFLNISSEFIKMSTYCARR